MKPIRALICDDDNFYRQLVKDLLLERGVEVLEARDGQEAMGVFLREEVDLVVTDFLMPRLDGLQFIRAIRSNQKRGRVPVILLSAISRTHIEAAEQEFMADYYLNKPFKPKKLAVILDRVLHTIRAARGAT